MPPRILIISDEQWPRALLRAALIDAGFDAVGARTVDAALRFPASDPDRGDIGLVIVDQGPAAGSPAALEALLARHKHPPTLLLASAVVEAPPGRWTRILRRPFDVGRVVAEAKRLVGRSD